MKIKNFNQLATTSLRKQALLIAEAAYQAIDTEFLTDKQFEYDAKKDQLTVMGKKYDLSQYKRVVVVGGGKVVAQAAAVIERKLGARLSAGVVVDIVAADLEIIKSRVGTHPLPSSANVAATQEMIDLVEHCDETTFVIALIGGGGSSLLSLPAQVSLEEERKIFKALLRSGADITEMNTVRKHLSFIKGGGLAKVAYPARVVSLIFSDVPGDSLEFVASGPTVKDSSSVHDAGKILSKYDILMHCSMDQCGLEETPKEDRYFKNVDNILFASSQQALDAMKERAKELGIEVKIWNKAYGGEARELAKQIVQSVSAGQCLIGAGESVVTIDESNQHIGKGGRNQEMALAAALEIKEPIVFGSFASDGRDNSDVAGGFVDHKTKERFELLKVDAQQELDNHNTYQLMLDSESSIMTGVTGSNISDFIICIKE
ncbi:MAG: DUF4147 domain-containing protein [Candidatus Doudnabacteria bacterium]